MAKTTKKKSSKSKKTPITLTLRLDPGPRKKLAEIAASAGVSETAIVQQLVDRYATKLDFGPRLDDLEARVLRLEGGAATVPSDPGLTPDDDDRDLDDDEDEDEDRDPDDEAEPESEPEALLD
jgi:hypothetical protein